MLRIHHSIWAIYQARCSACWPSLPVVDPPPDRPLFDHKAGIAGCVFFGTRDVS
jgi:hypothetical protein